MSHVKYWISRDSIMESLEILGNPEFPTIFNIFEGDEEEEEEAGDEVKLNSSTTTMICLEQLTQEMRCWVVEQK